MISYLKGRVIHQSEASIVVLCDHIGYEIQLPSGRVASYSIGKEIEIYTYTYIREDVLQLYGFDHWEEKDCFLLLLNVSGIGPKAALAIVGQSDIRSLQQAIVMEDIAFFTKIPGIGKKTAQRLILELKDKLPKEIALEISTTEPASAKISAQKDEFYEALASLGYQDREIQHVYTQLKPIMEDAPIETLLRKALQLLAMM